MEQATRNVSESGSELPCTPGPEPIANPHLNMFGMPWVAIPHEEQAKVIKEIPCYKPCGPMAGGFATPPTSPGLGPHRLGLTGSGSDTNRSVKTAGGLELRPSPHAAGVRAELLAQQQEGGKVVNTFLTFGTKVWVRERYEQEELNHWEHPK